MALKNARFIGLIEGPSRLSVKISLLDILIKTNHVTDHMNDHVIPSSLQKNMEQSSWRSVLCLD